jgi:hypothetical protein
MKKGDIIKITKFRNRKCSKPVWARVVDHNEVALMEWSGAPSLVLEAIRDVGTFRWTIDKTNPPDSWRTVKEEEVPDEIWAAIAKRVLSD